MMALKVLDDPVSPVHEIPDVLAFSSLEMKHLPNHGVLNPTQSSKLVNT